jgi:hypothetical protein
MSLLPRITMTDLQRRAKQALTSIGDYAVIQRHGKDVAFVMTPELGALLVETGILEVLKKKLALQKDKKPEQNFDAKNTASPETIVELDRILGQVLQELSKR